MKLRCIAALLLSPLLLTADGGRIIFHRVTNGLIVTLFASPSPLRVGPTNFSVFVQDAASSEAILYSSVKLTLTNSETGPVISTLRRSEATDTLLYGCQPYIPVPGTYKVLLEIHTNSRAAELTDNIDVLPPEPRIQTYWPYLTPVPLAIGLFAANRLLRRAKRPSS